MLYILIAILASLIIGVYLAWNTDFPIIVNIIGIVMIVGGAISSFAYSFTVWSWMAAEHKAKLINQEFHTNYSREDVFWASDVIEEIRELQRKRVEINGNVMGHGKDPGEEK